MSLMMSNVVDIDDKIILASCPFYDENPLCVNSCALFIPERLEVNGEVFEDFRYGWCGLGNGKTQMLTALSKEMEVVVREERGIGRPRKKKR